MAADTRLHTALARIAGPPDAAAPDAVLVGRFLDARDDRAFAELVRRHGPMVLGVCRRMLSDSHAADDAFQATFLVLARKAGTVRPRELVGNWLHGVAVRTAAHAKGLAARRRVRESGGADVSGIADRPASDPADAELAVRLDQVLAGLPERFRAAVVLCELEGRSIREVAAALGVPPGTVASRLARGRDLLAARMRAVGTAAFAAVVPPRLLARSAASLSDPAATSDHVSELVQKVSRDMSLSKLRLAAKAGLAVAAAAGLGLTTVPVPAAPVPTRPAAAAAARKPDWAPAQRPEAVRVRRLGPRVSLRN